TGCHEPGGVGPFPLARYEDVAPLAGLIRNAVVNHVMPPWPPASCCSEFRFDRSLSDQELDAIVSWIDAGTPSGDLGNITPGLRSMGGLSRVDRSVTMPAVYTPQF